MQKNLKKSLILLILLALKVFSAFTQEYSIDYCGVFSSDLDQNMTKLTGDLYFTQLSEFQNFLVSDRRAEFSQKTLSELDTTLFSLDKKTFCAEITKIPSTDRWKTVFHIFSKTGEVTKEKEYDSFYKILMEPKDNLKETLSNLITKGESASHSSFESAENQKTEAQKQGSAAVSTEFLSGTWKAEEGLNKVVIMRGGRGFVIFNNGASMNISIKLDENGGNKKITVIQNQRSNASYFPELSRTAALEHAVNAKPIEWTLQAKDSDTLIGKKHTLVETSGEIGYQDIPVTWVRVN